MEELRYAIQTMTQRIAEILKCSSPSITGEIQRYSDVLEQALQGTNYRSGGQY